MGDRRNLGHTSADRVTIWPRLRKRLIDEVADEMRWLENQAEEARLKANMPAPEPVDELTYEEQIEALRAELRGERR